jgi:hypothetical protein
MRIASPVHSFAGTNTYTFAFVRTGDIIVRDIMYVTACVLHVGARAIIALSNKGWCLLSYAILFYVMGEKD